MTQPASLAPAIPSPTSWLGWRWPLAGLVLAWLMTALVFRDTVVGMVTIWYRSETFNHCFLVLPISLWLAWRRRDLLQPLQPRPAPVFLLPLALTVVAWVLGDLVAVNSLTQLALVAMWVLAVPLLLGKRIAWALLFPLAFAFFSVPLGEFLLPQLMESTADFTVWALRLSGIPVHREGLQFVIPSGNWSVVEACSGVRYLIASLMVGALFSYLNYQTASRRILFMLVSLVVPIIANWLRAYMIVMLGHLSGNRLAVGVDHLIYGWVFFGIVILLMFVVGARWSEPEPARRMVLATSSVGRMQGSSPLWSVLGTLVACAVLLSLPDFVQKGLAEAKLSGTPVLLPPSSFSGDWQLLAQNPLGFTPSFRNPSAVAEPAYQSQAGTVGVYVGYYRNQDYDHKLVSSDNVLVPSGDTNWARLHERVRSVSVGSQTFDVRHVELRRLVPMRTVQSERLVAWQMYWIDGLFTSNDYLAKVYSVWKRLSGEGDESAVVVVYASSTDVQNSERLLSDFVTANLAQIEGMLARVRGESRASQ
jgi:exosortase A